MMMRVSHERHAGLGLSPSGRPSPVRAFTLIEVMLVIGMLLVLAYFVLPIFTGEIERRRLEDSISQMQSLINLTRAHAMNDGKRYRLRWPDEPNYEEASEKGLTLQPIIEVEASPIDQPGVFTEVNDVWAVGETLYTGVQCERVVLGRQQEPNEPNQFENEMSRIANGAEQMFQEDSDLDKMFQDNVTVKSSTEEEKDPNRPAIVFDPDGTAEWATIYLTNGTLTEEGELQTWEIFIDARTGNVGWRRTLSEEERQQATVDAEEQKEEHKIVRGREMGAR